MIETRVSCPVCLGVQMVKEFPSHRPNLTLDLCRRCGGIWFQPGEFEVLRSGSSFDLAKSFEGGLHTGRCHACLASIKRDAESCAACGAANKIDCPDCLRPMRRITHDGLTLDVCTKCRGVWFDRHEIAAIWTVAVAAIVGARAANSERGFDIGSDSATTALEALSYSPDVGGVIVEGTLRAAGTALEGISAAPEAAGLVLEAAGSVFEALASMVGAILDGLSF